MSDIEMNPSANLLVHPGMRDSPSLVKDSKCYQVEQCLDRAGLRKFDGGWKFVVFASYAVGWRRSGKGRQM
jgi:hypothetical protein